MLIEFRVANFRSFSGEQVFSLAASSDDSHPENLIQIEGLNLVRVAAIYGANASGKSNLIKAMRFVDLFVEDSATRMNKGDLIPFVVPFKLDLKSRDEPSRFGVTFAEEDETGRSTIVYSYSFSVTTERVHEEKLEVFVPGGRGQCWYERHFNADTGETTWSFRGPLKRHERLLKERTRENGLVLSRGAELNVLPLVKPFMWFRKRLWSHDLSCPDPMLTLHAKRKAGDDSTMANKILEMLKHADMGIDRLDVEKKPVSMEEVPEQLRSLFSEKGLQELTSTLSETNTEIYTLHRVPKTDKYERFSMNDESAGTQRFFELAGFWLEALEQGAVVVIDELETSLHPLLVKKLIELFQCRQAATCGAQLIFATHSTEIMDKELLRRDQIWFVDKRQDCGSELYSLYDFEERPRKDAAFRRSYLSGRFGGVPRFGTGFEDLALK